MRAYVTLICAISVRPVKGKQPKLIDWLWENEDRCERHNIIMRCFYDPTKTRKYVFRPYIQEWLKDAARERLIPEFKILFKGVVSDECELFLRKATEVVKLHKRGFRVMNAD